MNYLPSKKVAFALAVLALLVVGVFWYLGRSSERSGQSGLGAQATTTGEQTRDVSSAAAEIEAAIEPLVINLIGSGEEIPAFNLADYVKTYTSKNLLLGKDNSSSTLHTYGLAVAGALKPLGIPRQNEAGLMIAAIKSKDPDALAEITSAREVKELILKNLLAIRVPTEATTLHLSLINNLSTQIGIMKNMEQAFYKPVVALQSASFYPSELERFYRLAISVNEFFALRKISFTEAEHVKIESSINP